jgi:hypothetical protein
MSKLKASVVTQESWSFTLKNFSTFARLACIPFLVSLVINNVAMLSFLHGKPAHQAFIDGFGALIEAFWGVRWFQYVMKKRIQPFQFGKQEFLYFIYSLILLAPFMIDDFLFMQEIKHHHALGYIAFAFAFLVISLRFEFLFVSLALKKPTGFATSWKESHGYWKHLFKSFFQALTVLLPVAILALLGLGVLIVALWALGFMHFEGWTLHQGWQPLLNANPLISFLYVFFKEGLWFWMQAFTMVIAARYYQDALKA